MGLLVATSLKSGTRGLTSLMLVSALFIAPLNQALAGPAVPFRSLDSETQQEVVKWSRLQLEEFGPLLTPPAGKIPDDVIATQKLVEDMIEKMAGRLLRERGIRIVVDIYGSPVANAYAKEIAPGQAFTPSSEWQRNHPGKPWPIQTLYGYGESETLHELALSTGLINRFGTVDELAFVVAHELTHFLEEHTRAPQWKLSSIANRWWSSQQYEVIADLGALKLMKGHYDLNGGVKALTLLANLSPAPPGSIKAGTNSHHEDGVRLATAQMAVQKILESAASAHRTSTPMPSFAKLGRMSARAIRHPDLPTFKDQFRSILRPLLDDPKSIWVLPERDTYDLSPEFSFGYKNVDDLKELFLLSMDEISASKNSSEMKLLAAFKVLALFKEFYMYPQTGDIVDRLTNAEIGRVRHQLSLMTPKENGDLVSILSVFKSRQYSRFAQSFLRELERPALHRLFGPLMERSPQWVRLADFMVSLGEVDDGGRRSSANLRFILDQLNEKASRLSSVDRQIILALARRLKSLSELSDVELKKELFSNQGGEPFAFFKLFKREVEFRDTKEWKGRSILNAALKKLDERLVPERNRMIEAALHPAPGEARIITYLAPHAVSRDHNFPLEIETRRELQKIFVEQGGFTPAGWETSEYVSTVTVAAETMDDSGQPKSLRARAFDMLLANAYGATYDLVPGAERAFVARAAKDYIEKTLGLDRFMSRYVKESLEPGVWRLVGQQPELSEIIASRLEPARRAKYLADLTTREESFVLDMDRARFWTDLLIASRDNVAFDVWGESLLKLLDRNPVAREARYGSDAILREHIVKSITRLSAAEQRPWVSRLELLKILDPKESAALLTDYVRKSQAGKSRIELAESVFALAKQLDLAGRAPLVERAFRTEMAKAFALQPNEARTFFPETDDSITERSADATGYIRMLSTLAAEIHRQSPQDQYEAIRYLIGQDSVPPTFLVEAAQRSGQDLTILSMLKDLRNHAMNGSSIERIFIINSILAGPHGLMARPGGEEFLLKKIVSQVRSNEMKPLASELARALLSSYGSSRTLPAALVLNGDAEPRLHPSPSKESPEAVVFKSLLVAHGAPGIKFGQYLAFTTPSLRGLLSSLQDNAVSLDRLEVLEAIETRFGRAWPEKYEVVKVLGSGSVNVAIEIKDRESGTSKVMSLTYPDAETKTAENFRRLERLIENLIVTPEGLVSYGYLKELLPIIRDSVGLEFDKANAFAVQREAALLYRGQRDGWSIRTVPVDSARNMSLLMDKAPGVTARKLFESDPDTYRSAMDALSGIERRLLMGRISPSIAAFANPDFHDGQVLIDKATKTVTILDFGQAAFISHDERELGVRLLRTTTGLDSAVTIERWIAATFKTSQGEPIRLGSSEIKLILSQPERIDRFVRLVARIRAKGGAVPVASVHWVLAIHRQVELSARLGTNFNVEVATLLLASKLGVRAEKFARLMSPIATRARPSDRATVRTCERLFGI